MRFFGWIRKKKERREVNGDAELRKDALESDWSAKPDRNEEEGNGFLLRFRQGLSKTRAGLSGRVDRLMFGKKQIDEELLEELEEILFTSDLGVETTRELIERLHDRVERRELDRPEKLRDALKENILAFLEVPQAGGRIPGPGEPLVIMVVGVNGVGKTTTIGKWAHLFRKEGKKVMLVAADTFRAAAAEQLIIWGQRVGAEVVRQKEGADPSAVVFDAVNSALSRSMDVVLIDTAGRLHTKVNLMDELRKIQRVAGKRLPGAPHETWLVLDANTGQNAVSQAKMFNSAIGITGVVLTKLDGTAKGGIVVGISHQLKLPVRYIGLGEKVDDLRPFHPREFVDAIFE